MTAADRGKVSCPVCRRRVGRRPDGSLAAHRAPGGWRCLSPDWTRTQPEWLGALAEAHAAGVFPELWPAERVAEYLGVNRKRALLLLRQGGVTAAATGAGRAKLFDRLDVEDFQVRRERGQARADDRAQRRRRAYGAGRAARSRRRRFASRELIDGRLVATKAEAHGVAGTYNNWGCRCQPCTAAQRAVWNAWDKRRREGHARAGSA